jgi:hypothetical protein
MATKTLPDASDAFDDLWKTKPIEGDERYGIVGISTRDSIAAEGRDALLP